MKSLFILLGLLFFTVLISCSEKPKDTAVESAENIEDTAAYNSIVNPVADADDAKENIEDIADEFFDKTKSSDVTVADGKKSVGVASENDKEAVPNPNQKTKDIVRYAEEKTKEGDDAVKNTERVTSVGIKNNKDPFEVSAETGKEAVGSAAKNTKEVIANPTQNTEDVIRKAEEKPKDIPVTVENSKQSIEGIWDTGTENTKIEISQNNGAWVGKIKSSDNQEVTLGKVILKDLKKQNDKWKGKLFVVKKQKWTDVEIIPNGTKLDLTISAGFTSKRVQWSKAEN